MSTFPKLLLIGLLCGTSSLSALGVQKNKIKNQALFGIEFPQVGQAYYAKEATVRSISIQEYVTTTFRVLELNIVSDGNALVRIYHSRPMSPSELTAAVADATAAAGAPSSIVPGQLPSSITTMAAKAMATSDSLTGTTVIKEYPLATHARTIEYRMRSRNELIELYSELEKHWKKEPAYFEDGQIVDEANQTTESKLEPRSLGGTLFMVEN